MDTNVTQPSTLAEAVEAVCGSDAPLNERLSAYAQSLRRINPPLAEAYDRLIGRLAAGVVGASAPRAGDVMPPFILPTRAGRLVSLFELIGKGPVVITLNRGHWCSYCRIQLRTIAAQHDEIAALGAEVVSIVPDRQQFVGRLREETFDRLQLLSDIDNAYSLSLGLVTWMDDRLRELTLGNGYDLEAIQGACGWFVPLPATFVVGPDGRVAARQVDPDFRKRMEIEDILRALRAAGD
jgi:peroxiredoxin